jgi:OOP family OmpA-OmpF porin
MRNLLLLTLLYCANQISAQNLKPTPTQALINVLVVDDKKKPQAGQEVTFTSQKDGKKYNGTTDAAGKFSLLMPPGQKYNVLYKIFTTVHDKLVLDLPVSEGAYTFDYTITATPPRTFTLNDVFFDSGKSTLKPESDKQLNEMAEFMNLKKTLVIEIAGHTDNVGSPESNQKLSEDRANSVKQYLVKKGIAAERLKAKGYGDTMPIADNGTDTGKQQNRRTEVHIISE